jgi:ketosteroid isomerase-like protein
MSQDNVETIRRIYEDLNRGEVEGVVELCDDDFLMDMSERVFKAQSRTGGPGVDWRVAWLWKVREGRPVFVRFYRDQADALEAAGLRE